MKSTQGVRTLALMLAVMAACMPPFRAYAQQPTTATSAELIQSDIDSLSTALNNTADGHTDDDREEAAKRLVSRQSPEAQAVLLAALSNNANAPAQLAVAKALADDGPPDPAMIEPLLKALRGPRNLQDPAARALARYANPSVLNQLIAIAEQRREPELLRSDIVRALGSTAEKRIALSLVNLVKSPEEPESVRTAAAAALAEISGLNDYGRDAQRWSDWWSRNNQKSDVEFHNEVIARRAADLDRTNERLSKLTDKMGEILARQYQATPAPQKQDFLIEKLTDPIPEIRSEAARLVYVDAMEPRNIPNPVRAQLRTMIGDSDPHVRSNTARALAAINDPPSLKPLLAQLNQEKDGIVRVDLINALAPINDLQAAPAIIELLKDPSSVVATAAARAIARFLGPEMYKEHSPLLPQTAQTLHEVFDRQQPDAGNSDLREALINAMAPLKQSDLLSVFQKLLRANESVEIRIAAVGAIGELGDPRAANTIANALTDPKARVRYVAVAALEKLPNANSFYGDLVKLVKNANEDISVREEAWKVLQGILPELSSDQLLEVIGQFRDDAEKRLFVQRDLEDKFKAGNSEDDLATLRQNIGSTERELQQWQDAADYFSKALEYKKARATPTQAPTITDLQDKLMEALLNARRYADAIAFAAQSIKEDPGMKQPMGSRIVNQVRDLQDAAKYADALELALAAEQMDPPLLPTYLTTLRDLEKGIRAKIPENGSPNPGRGTTQPSTRTGAAPR